MVSGVYSMRLGVLLAGSRVYSTKVRISCSVHKLLRVRPQPPAVTGLKGPRLAMLHSCHRSLTPSGMESCRPELSQSDSRLGAIELTELDSTTILSAYDST